MPEIGLGIVTAIISFYHQAEEKCIELCMYLLMKVWYLSIITISSLIKHSTAEQKWTS